MGHYSRDTRRDLRSSNGKMSWKYLTVCLHLTVRASWGLNHHHHQSFHKAIWKYNRFTKWASPLSPCIVTYLFLVTAALRPTFCAGLGDLRKAMSGALWSPTWEMGPEVQLAVPRQRSWGPVCSTWGTQGHQHPSSMQQEASRLWLQLAVLSRAHSLVSVSRHRGLCCEFSGLTSALIPSSRHMCSCFLQSFFSSK